MKKYGPYLLYQIARFGALSVPQMIEVCQGRCARSSLYRALDELTSGRFVYPILNPASKTRAYYATKEGCEYVFGKSAKSSTAIKAAEVDHTIICAEVLLELCRRENVTASASTMYSIDIGKHSNAEWIAQDFWSLPWTKLFSVCTPEQFKKCQMSLSTVSESLKVLALKDYRARPMEKEHLA